MSTTKDLVKTHNELAAERGLPPLQGWKAGKDQLQAKIDGMMAVAPTDPLAIPEDVQDGPGTFGDAEPDTVSPNGAEETTDEPVEPTDAPEPSVKPKGIGAMVKELLLDPNGYDYPFIVEAVRREFPTANTSTRSIASVAAALRRSGVEFPMRRKPRKE